MFLTGVSHYLIEYILLFQANLFSCAQKLLLKYIQLVMYRLVSSLINHLSLYFHNSQ